MSLLALTTVDLTSSVFQLSCFLPAYPCPLPDAAGRTGARPVRVTPIKCIYGLGSGCVPSSENAGPPPSPCRCPPSETVAWAEADATDSENPRRAPTQEPRGHAEALSKPGTRETLQRSEVHSGGQPRSPWSRTQPRMISTRPTPEAAGRTFSILLCRDAQSRSERTEAAGTQGPHTPRWPLSTAEDTT